MANPVLIKIDRNGTKYYSDDTCQRCGGQGERSEWYYTGMICFECGGTGRSRPRIYKEYTPEYQAKLDAKRAAKLAAQEAKRAEEEAKREKERKEREEKLEAERLAKEAELAKERAISQYVGSVGDRLTADVLYIGSPYFKRRPFHAWNPDDFEYVYLHTFKDENGNKIIWKTTRGIELDEGLPVKISGTIKEHSEYKGEKQTIIQRCKIAS